MPITAGQFRRIALSLDDVVEGSHMGHADFRVNGKIFATLGYPNQKFGMVKVAPWQQHELAEAYPKAFTPVKGKWGLGGATSVTLSECKVSWIREALSAAHRTVLAGRKTAAPKTRRSSRSR